MDPFDVLAEAAVLSTVELPSVLSRIYGGDLAFSDSCVYANFVATLDAVVAIPDLPNSNEVISGGSEPDRFLMGLLRALADAVLIGAGVLRASPRGTWRAETIYPAAAEAYGELRRKLHLPAAPEIAIVTGSGSIDPAHPVLTGRAVVLTSDAGAERLAGRIPEPAVIVSLGGQTHFQGEQIVDALRERGHRRILCEAGPHTFGSLVEARRIDELFLTTSPFLAGDGGGGSRLRLVEAADLVPLVESRLLSVRRHGDHLFTRYAIGA
ncbi:MAG TPA: dihydrofolate reductase family protein [Gaiellaceae bacterium]|nr:dihydrofolate reductase family protein [Gaiellaceae bacterium]